MQENDFKELLEDESFINYCLKNNSQDIERWENWLKANPEYRKQIEELKTIVIALGFHTGNTVVEQEYLDLKSRIAQRQTTEKLRTIFYSGWLKYAAALVLVTGAVLIWYQGKNTASEQQLSQTTTQEISPGGNKAILTLADGSTISLTDAVMGRLNEQAGVTVTKTAEGEIEYTNDINSGSLATAYNKIETPKGGKYEIRLPDGSKAWLNAASSLKYPLSFTGNERRVEMTGEVYFEVAKDKYRPFRVKTATQEIEVLGTHFNVNAYADEDVVRTTLVEGSVRISLLKTKESVLLKPGQLATTCDHIKVGAADLDEELAWKNGDFIFKGETLESIMRKVSRWYDVDVVYTADIPSVKFDGMVSRSRNLSAIINMIESTGKIHLKVQGRRITVMK